MNRQMRREQKRLDQKQEKEKERKKDARRARLTALRRGRRERAQARQARRESQGGEAESGRREVRRPPGRFAGFLAIVAALGITLLPLNAISQERTTAMLFLFYGAYFLMFSYFAVQWLLRRGSSRAIPLSLTTGTALALGVAATTLLAPEGSPQGLLPLLVGVPALALGAYLGRFVWHKASE